MTKATNMNLWTKWYEAVQKNAFNGPDKVSLEFFLLDLIDPRTTDDIEAIKDMIFTSAQFFSVQHNMKLREAEQIFASNIRYIAGYYDIETRKKWRKIITEYVKERGLYDE